MPCVLDQLAGNWGFLITTPSPLPAYNDLKFSCLFFACSNLFTRSVRFSRQTEAAWQNPTAGREQQKTYCCQ